MQYNGNLSEVTVMQYNVGYLYVTEVYNSLLRSLIKLQRDKSFTDISAVF